MNNPGIRELLAKVKATWRIITEQNIEDNQILLKACIDSPKDMIVLAINKKYNYLAFNTYHKFIMLQAYGIKIEPGMNILECITNEDDKIKSRINYEKAIQGESHTTIEEYGELDRHYYETRYNPIYNEKKEIIGVTAFSSNVTERIHIEESLNKSEEKFRKAFATIPDSITITRLSDGKFILVNEGFTKITGYSEEEIRNKTSDEIDLWLDPNSRQQIILGLKKEGKFHNLEGIFKHKDGSLRNGIMSASVIELEGIQHIISLTKDITDFKLSEDALRESERLLRESQEVAHLGSFVWDIKIGLWKSSKILDEILGIDENYFRSFEGWLNLVHPDWQTIMSDYVTNEVLGKHKKFDKEYQIVRPNDKQIIWVHGLSALEFDKNNQPLLLIGTISDITDRKLTEIELKKSHEELEKSKLAALNLLEDVINENEARKKSEENYRKAEIEISQLNRELEQRVIQRTAELNAANKELEAFAYSVSHDLRAPLRAIDGFSKFVLEDYSKNFDEEGKRLLILIRKNTEKMDQLITNILALSRVTRGDHRESDIDMTKMVMSMYNECVIQENRKKLNFIIGNLPNAFGDPIFLKQVWTNLISNAVKFSSLKSKPVIKVEGTVENGFNIYQIQDNGAGYNPEYADKLFGVFQRLHKVDEFEGTGVGLAIVQRIIHRHGGEVWAEGKEGEGATFYFSLPVKKEIMVIGDP